MITDTIDNIDLYIKLGSRINKAITFLKTSDFSTMPVGKYQVENEEIFALVNEYETKDKADCEVEAHRKYIDIQYMVRGTELFGYCPLTTQLPVTEYNPEKDVAFYSEDVSYIKLEAGMFIMFYPTDLHQPEVRAFEPMMVKKVVMKIMVEP